MELDEAYAGLAYIHEHAAELHVDGNKIVIMGDSAGGGLTARMALWNKDKGNVPVKGEVLLYLMLNYRTGGPDDLYKRRNDRRVRMDKREQCLWLDFFEA